MSTFRRELKKFMPQLKEDALRENTWLIDMLRYWRPPGELIGKRLGEQDALQAGGHALEQKQKHLRLAIRDGYINFYCAGQSVAKVGVNRKGEIQAKIHNKYVGDDSSGEGYVTLTSAGFKEPGTGRLVPYRGVVHLDKWVANAIHHSGTEKRFVDQVVAYNPDVIDLEMGLPAYSTSPNERRAPRMDLVAMEPSGQGWRIVFWEAKLARNGDARCSGQVIPKLKPRVLKQLGDYTDWLRHENNCELVAREYKRACGLLVELHEIVKQFNPSIEELGAGIRAVAADSAQRLLVDDKPRLLIDGRDPNPTHSFTENGHLEELCKTGLHVQMVKGDDQMTLDTCS